MNQFFNRHPLKKYPKYYDFKQSFNDGYNQLKDERKHKGQGMAGCDHEDYVYFIEYINEKRPKHIVEYGSGWSTMIIDKVITDLDYGAEFISFEEDEYWYNHIKEYNFDVNDRVNLVPIEKSYPNGKAEWDVNGQRLPSIKLISKKLSNGPWVTYIHDFEKIEDVDWVILDGPYLHNYGDFEGDTANGTLNLELLLNKFGGPMDVWIDQRFGTQEYYNAIGYEIIRTESGDGIGTNLIKNED